MKTKISSFGEFGLIDRIKKIIGDDIIGDDCAPIKIGKTTLLATTDVLLEDRHFLRRYPAEKIGFKAVSVNVSDIVASGGRPESLLISLMIPDLDTEYVDKLYKGIQKACRLYRCRVIGGNIASSEKIAIDIFMLGKTNRFVSRREAKIGDSVYLTGFVGGSRAGLYLLQKNKDKYEGFEKRLIEKHLSPIINIKVSDTICSFASSSIDVSDGLSSDAAHISHLSKVRIDIDAKKIPISQDLKKFCRKYFFDPVDFALSGGEDYVQLVTSNKKLNLIKIGQVSKGQGVFIGKKRLIKNGFDHFNKQ